MKISPCQGLWNATILLPGSKSLANRLLILAAMDRRDISIEGIPESDDVVHLLHALQSIGMDARQEGHRWTLKGCFPDCEKVFTPLRLQTGAGGTTNRFLLALLSLGRREYHLYPDPEFLARPNDELIQCLQGAGANVRRESDHLVIQGPLRERSVDISSERSSQFASALLLLKKAIPDLSVRIHDLHASESYIRMSERVLGYSESHSSWRTPPDWSSASYPMVFASHTGHVHLPQLTTTDSLQGDSSIVDILRRGKVSVLMDSSGCHVNAGPAIGVEWDCSSCLDLVPSLVFYAAYANSPSRLTGIRNLVYKESDRLVGLRHILNAFRIDHSMQTDELVIMPSPRIQEPVALNLPADHRLVMTAFLFMRLNAGGTLSPHTAVSKSFPKFFDVMN